MHSYLLHLHHDLEAAIRTRWRKNPPHFWQAGLPDPYLILPEGLNDIEPQEEAPIEATFEEAEKFVEGRPELTMFYHFGFEPEQFPPADKLTDEQLDKLVFAILRLWAAFNFGASLPERVPARVAYPVLLKKMGEPAMVFEFGHCGVEFCHYEPAECPWGLEWCDCKEFISQ